MQNLSDAEIGTLLVSSAKEKTIGPFKFVIGPFRGMAAPWVQMYRSYNPEHTDPSEESEGQFGKGHYLAPTEDDAHVFDDDGHEIAVFEVGHPKVLEIHELENQGDEDNLEMLKAATQFTGIPAKTWDQFNKKLEAKGFGGLAIYYGKHLGEFVGFGNHVAGKVESKAEEPRFHWKKQILEQEDGFEVNVTELGTGEHVGNITVTRITNEGFDDDEAAPEIDIYREEKFFKQMNKHAMITDIRNLNVEDAFQGQGVGKYIYNLALQEIKKRYPNDPVFINASPMGGDIDLENLIAFYTKAGFKVLKKYSEYRNAALWIEDPKKIKLVAAETEEYESYDIDWVELADSISQWVDHSDGESFDNIVYYSKKLPPDLTTCGDELFRGHSGTQEGFEKLQAGAKLKVKAGSWSIDEKEAAKFALGRNDYRPDTFKVVFQIETKPGQVMLNLQEAITHPMLEDKLDDWVKQRIQDEGEVLLNEVTITKDNIVPLKPLAEEVGMDSDYEDLFKEGKVSASIELDWSDLWVKTQIAADYVGPAGNPNTPDVVPYVTHPMDDPFLSIDWEYQVDPKVEAGKQVGILYHFTTPAAFVQIVEDGWKLRTVNREQLSFTRDFDLKFMAAADEHDEDDESTGNTHDVRAIVRITVDGDVLSNKYKIKPFADGGPFAREGGNNESEQIIPGTEADIGKAVLQVDMLNGFYYEKEYGKEFKYLDHNREDVGQESRSHGVEFNAVGYFTPYLGEDRIASEVTANGWYFWESKNPYNGLHPMDDPQANVGSPTERAYPWRNEPPGADRHPLARPMQSAVAGIPECEKIAQWYMDNIFRDDTLPMPTFKISNQLKATWLGRCEMKHSYKVPIVQVQKSILGDEATLDRVIAHEMIHVWQYMCQPEYLEYFQLARENNGMLQREDANRIKRKIRHLGGHEDSFKEWAAKINAVKGKDYVTEKSNDSYVLTDSGKEFFILIEPTKTGKLGYNTFSKKTPQIKEALDSRIEKQGAKLFRTSDQSLLAPKSLKLYGGCYVPKAEEGQEKLKKIFESGEVVAAHLIEAAAQFLNAVQPWNGKTKLVNGIQLDGKIYPFEGNAIDWVRKNLNIPEPDLNTEIQDLTTTDLPDDFFRIYRPIVCTDLDFTLYDMIHPEDFQDFVLKILLQRKPLPTEFTFHTKSPSKDKTLLVTDFMKKGKLSLSAGPLPDRLEDYIMGEESFPTPKELEPYRQTLQAELKALYPSRYAKLYRGMTRPESPDILGEIFTDPNMLISFTESKATAIAIAKQRAQDYDEEYGYAIEIDVPTSAIYFHWKLDPIGKEHPKEKEVLINPYGFEWKVIKAFAPGGKQVAAETVEAELKVDHHTVMCNPENCQPDDMVEQFKQVSLMIPNDALYGEHPYKTDSDGRETEPHVTVLYGLKNDSDLPAIVDYAANFPPLEFTIGKVSAFRNADKPYDVLKIAIDSPSMEKLHYWIRENFENACTFPFSGHMTLAYIKKGTCQDLEGPCDWTGEKYSCDVLTFSHKTKGLSDFPMDRVDQVRVAAEVILASPKMETLKKNKKPLSEEEREIVMKAGAVWHHGPDGEETPAVWKAVIDDKEWFCCNTHRAMQVKPTLKGAIKAFEFIKTTSSLQASAFKDEGMVDGNWGSQASGILFKCGPRVLLLKRAYWTMDPLLWGIPGGAVPVDETGKPMDVKESAEKETAEEIGGVPGDALWIDKVVFQDGKFQYTTFLVEVAGEFDPILNDEHTDAHWFGLTELPPDIHPGVKWAIEQFIKEKELEGAT